MNKILVAALVLVVLIFGVAWVLNNRFPAKGQIVRIGENISFSLDSNATTGYQWQLARPLDNNFVELVSSVYLVPNTGRVGTGGTEIWTFKALKVGRTKIYLKYVRPWEKDEPPAETRVFDVKIIKRT
ncbi:MAG: protease inhibitor I42 family protein [Candidatus Margulisbacteria bacterium]|nr:protease inhibitor I42 family protein [Candidatus Margulisiibacteriota bacterium]